MSNVAQVYPLAKESRCFGPATVVQRSDASGMVRVRLCEQPPRGECWARVAVPNSTPLDAGAQVLVAGDEPEGLYVIGVLDARPAGGPVTQRLDLGDDAYAAVVGPSASPKLQVVSRGGGLVFEYDPGAEKAWVALEEGDLGLRTKTGNIAIEAAGDIRLTGQAIDLSGRAGVRLSAHDAVEQLRSAVSVGLGRLKLSSPDLDVTARRGRFHIEETRYWGGKFSAVLGQAQLTARRLRTATETLIENAKNVYRTVEELAQLKAGRARTLVDSTCHLKAKRTYLKAEEDFKVKAEKIHLG